MARTANGKHTLTPEAAVDRLEAIYAGACAALSRSLDRYLVTRKPPTAKERAAFRYPLLRVVCREVGAAARTRRAYAKFQRPGVYATTVTHPGHFRRYLLEQLEPLVAEYGAEISVDVSSQEIPYPYVLERVEDIGRSGVTASELASHFPTPLLSLVGDEVADGQLEVPEGEPRPLSLFDAVRVDYSLRRLVHYTGSDWRNVQQWILLTNYHRYVDQFVRWGLARLGEGGGPYERMALPGGAEIGRGNVSAKAEEAIAASPWHRYQMPAYHLMARDGQGVTLVNIGVGPSNAKNITDHLAVLRPNCWLMVGHCGGLRQSQQIGDYVLAHAYLRQDGILDSLVPPDVPIPALAEVQIALQDAAGLVTGETRRGPEATPAHRHRRHQRRPQLGAALHPGAAPHQSVARDRRRHGERHGRRQRLSPARALRHAALRLRQAAARRDQAAGRRQRLLRKRGRPAPGDRTRGPRLAAPTPRHAAFAQAALLRRATLQIADAGR